MMLVCKHIAPLSRIVSRTQWFFLLSLLLAVVALTTANTITINADGTTTTTTAVPQQQQQQDLSQHHADALVAWVRSKKGGYFNPKLIMRRVDPSDPSSHFGMFAKENIPKDSLLFRLPHEIILHSLREQDDDDDEDGENGPQPMDCGLVRSLIQELRLKDESDYAPYVNYLLDTQPPGQLPSSWSKAGKELLMQVLGHEDFSYDEALENLEEDGDLSLENVLPPMDPIGWIEHEWYGDCKGSDDPMEEYAALLVVQRSWDDILVPIYDMLSHRNGHWFNTRSNGVHGRQPIVVQALRDIEAGEEIYGSYNMCEDCSNRIHSYGTGEILRDYGFVEQFPQTWIFPDIEFGFRVDVDDEMGDDSYVVTEWIDREPSDEDLEALEEKLKFVNEKLDGMDRDAYLDIPQSEWDKILKYLESMKIGLVTALHWENDAACIENGTCKFSLDRYTNLDEHYETELETGYMDSTCDIEAQFVRFDNGEMVPLESFKSQYQQINYLWNPKDRGTCMDLDDTVQICDAYRPHYHEYAVHHAARFMPKDSIRRALFVGGGDSMLLHEILKYPSLELVVGLELDQKVTRGCFKHFGTQPHFHDSRVEWWFGDASKSLLMLPKEYFGSFDLVLVDLSETVMSFQVTDEIDVVEALSLLVKPDGVFVKNEVYFDKFRNMFPYSVLINWYDNPIICSQVMVMGSRTIDFMHPTLTEHGTSNLVVRSLEDTDDKFELYHDYAFNASTFDLCDRIATSKEDSNIQERSPGIVLVVEAEDVSGDLTGENMKTSMVASLKEKGFEIISSDFSEADGNAIVYLVLNEGYIIARSVIASKYVGFDIHFWSGLHKHEDAKNAVVNAVGGSGTNLSTYRVIAGGMFGTKTWREDEKLRGPQFEDICDAIKDKAQDIQPKSIMKGVAEQVDIDMATELGLKLLRRDGLKIAMLIGNEDDTKDVASKHYKTVQGLSLVNEVITLNCPSMVGFNEYSADAANVLGSCEKFMYSVFKDSVDGRKFDAIIVDSTADKFTASILLKLLSLRRAAFLAKYLEPDALVITSITDDENEAWKRNLMLRIKDESFIDSPAAFAEIAFENTKNDSGFKLIITNDGGEYFINRLNSTLTELKSDDSNSLNGVVQIIHGGEWLFQENFVPSRSFLPDDYDQSGPLAQWQTQNPIGHQFILQLEANPRRKTTFQMSSTHLKDAVKNTLEGVEFFSELQVDDVKEFSDLGTGSLLIAVWSKGSLAVLWDGKTHVDVNLFTYVEDIKIGDQVQDKFLQVLRGYQTVLRDEQPRGMGRVVAYQRDLQGNTEPHWA